MTPPRCLKLNAPCHTSAVVSGMQGALSSTGLCAHTMLVNRSIIHARTLSIHVYTRMICVADINTYERIYAQILKITLGP
jgi:hypothetical protein